MKPETTDAEDDLRPEYDFDFSQGERGRYFKRMVQEGSNVVILDPDIARAFPDSLAVNNALRSLMEIARAAAGGPQPAPSVAKRRRAGVG